MLRLQTVLGWCDNCNTPILDAAECGLCGTQSREIHLKGRGEVRPIFEFEREYFNNVLSEVYGTGLLPEGTLFSSENSKQTSRCDVFCGGKRILEIVFDEERRRWSFIPSLPCCSGPLSKKLVKLSRDISFTLRTHKSIYSSWIDEYDPDIQIGDNIIFDNGRICGIAHVVGPLAAQNRVVMHIREEALTEDLSDNNGGCNLDRVVEANIHILEKKEKKSQRIIEEELRKGQRHCVSYSGGKDSAVAMLLAMRVNPDIDVAFLDTGIEYPETISHVEELTETYDSVFATRATSDFFESWKVFGPPSRHNRWCCKTQKFAPMNRLIRERYAGSVVTIVGSRMAESQSRLLTLSDVGSNIWLPKQRLVHPIRDWSSLDVWLYLLWKRFPYNSAYELGFARVGCWACPFTPSGTFELQRTTHPDLMRRLERELTSFAVGKGIDSGELLRNWTNRKRGGIYEVEKPLRGFSPCIEEDLIYPINGSRRDLIRSFMKVFNSGQGFFKDTKVDGVQVLSRLEGKIHISLTRDSVRVSLPNGRTKRDILSGEIEYYRDLFRKAEKMIWRGLNCVACGSCISSCESDAIELKGGRLTINDSCNGCLACTEHRCPTVNLGRGA